MTTCYTFIATDNIADVLSNLRENMTSYSIKKAFQVSLGVQLPHVCPSSEPGTIGTMQSMVLSLLEKPDIIVVHEGKMDYENLEDRFAKRLANHGFTIPKIIKSVATTYVGNGGFKKQGIAALDRKSICLINTHKDDEDGVIGCLEEFEGVLEADKLSAYASIAAMAQAKNSRDLAITYKRIVEIDKVRSLTGMRIITGFMIKER